MAGGQLHQYGAMLVMNALAGRIVPAVQSSAPTWKPGLYWVDTGNSNVVKAWNGSAWVVYAGQRYLCLLTANPATAVAGNPAVNVADLTEVQTAGYARQLVSLADASSAYPSVVTDNGLVSWGPFLNDMALPSSWVAMVTSSSGTGGQLLSSWNVETQQAEASTMIQIATSQLTLSQS